MWKKTLAYLSLLVIVGFVGIGIGTFLDNKILTIFGYISILGGSIAFGHFIEKEGLSRPKKDDKI